MFQINQIFIIFVVLRQSMLRAAGPSTRLSARATRKCRSGGEPSETVFDKPATTRKKKKAEAWRKIMI